MSEIARILLLSVHLLSVNVAAGGPILCIWLEWQHGPKGREAIRYLATGSLACMLVGGLIGIAIGWIEWDDRSYQSLWTIQLERKVFFAVLEFLFSAVLLLGYWLWRKSENASRWISALRSFLLFVAATNLLYHFPPLFFNGQRLLDDGEASGPLTSSDFRRLMFSGETPALTVHFVVASVAVAGLALALLALRWGRLGRAEDARWVAVSGARWSLGSTLLQLPVGLWTLTTLPTSMQNELVGSNPLGLIVFASGLLATLWLTRELVSISMGEASRAALMRAMLAMLVTVGLMTASHEIARQKRRSTPKSTAHLATSTNRPHR